MDAVYEYKDTECCQKVTRVDYRKPESQWRIVQRDQDAEKDRQL